MIHHIHHSSYSWFFIIHHISHWSHITCYQISSNVIITTAVALWPWPRARPSCGCALWEFPLLRWCSSWGPMAKACSTAPCHGVKLWRASKPNTKPSTMVETTRFWEKSWGFGQTSRSQEFETQRGKEVSQVSIRIYIYNIYVYNINLNPLHQPSQLLSLPTSTDSSWGTLLQVGYAGCATDFRVLCERSPFKSLWDKSSVSEST